MKCRYCLQPILKYPAWSEHDPTWVHANERGHLGSEYCCGGKSAEPRIAIISQALGGAR